MSLPFRLLIRTGLCLRAREDATSLSGGLGAPRFGFGSLGVACGPANPCTSNCCKIYFKCCGSWFSLFMEALGQTGVVAVAIAMSGSVLLGTGMGGLLTMSYKGPGDAGGLSTKSRVEFC